MTDGSTAADGASTWAVVVTYRPDVVATTALLAATRPQVDGVVVVDNGSEPAQVAALREACAAHDAALVELTENLGIAEAQNRGITAARDAAEPGLRHVLLLDQDSVPAPDMVSRLCAAMDAARAAGGRVAAVGPITSDDRAEGAVLLFTAKRWGPRRATVPAGDGALVPAVFLIASGCLIDVEALDVIGPMRSEWFIDHIDLEWGLRAGRAGYAMYGVTGAALRHRLGDRTVRIPGREHQVHVHAPVRNYFMLRNTVLLIRSGLMPVAWRWGYAAWLVKYAGFYLLCTPPRLLRGRLMAHGLRDGLAGRTGPLPTADTTHRPTRGQPHL